MSGLMAKGPPPTPGFFIFLKIALGVLSFAVFIASCFNVAQLNGFFGVAYSAGAGGLGIWTCIFTFAFLGVEIFLGMSMHNLYLRIVFIIWLAFMFIFWLSTWADAAAGAAILSVCGDFNDVCRKYGGSLAAIAAIGAFCWLIVIALLLFYVLACVRDTSASNNYQPNNQPNAELFAVKPDGTQQPFVAGQQPQPGQPQPGYAQPQYGQP